MYMAYLTEKHSQKHPQKLETILPGLAFYMLSRFQGLTTQKHSQNHPQKLTTIWPQSVFYMLSRA